MREIPQIDSGHVHIFISRAPRSRILQNEFTQSCYPSVFPFPPGPWPLLKQDRCPPHELAPASHHHHAPRQSHCHHHLNRHLNRPSWSIRSLKISKVTQTEWVQATFTMWILCGGGVIPQVPWISILRNCSWFHKADSSVRFCLSSDRSTASHCSPSTCFGPPPPACFVPWWITSPPCCTPLPPWWSSPPERWRYSSAIFYPPTTYLSAAAAVHSPPFAWRCPSHCAPQTSQATYTVST